MTRAEMHDFARAGAQARLEAISEERAAIIRMFPDLPTRATAGAAWLDGSGPAAQRSRKRRRMSAAERKAVGKRMKAYWAKRRAERARSANPKPKRKSGMSAEARKAQAERMKAFWAAKRAQETNAGSAAAEATDTGGSPSRKASRKAGGRKAGQRRGPKK